MINAREALDALTQRYARPGERVPYENNGVLLRPADAMDRVVVQTLVAGRLGIATNPAPTADDLRHALAAAPAAHAHVDQLERTLLELARGKDADGRVRLTWRQIAEALGLDSEQAAQQRYRRLIARTDVHPDTVDVRVAAHRAFATREEYHAAYPQAEPSRVGTAVSGSDYGASFVDRDGGIWLVTFSQFGPGDALAARPRRAETRGNVVACRREPEPMEILVLAEDVPMTDADELVLPAISNRLEWVAQQCQRLDPADQLAAG